MWDSLCDRCRGGRKGNEWLEMEASFNRLLDLCPKMLNLWSIVVWPEVLIFCKSGTFLTQTPASLEKLHYLFGFARRQLCLGDEGCSISLCHVLSFHCWTGTGELDFHPVLWCTFCYPLSMWKLNLAGESKGAKPRVFLEPIIFYRGVTNILKLKAMEKYSPGSVRWRIWCSWSYPSNSPPLNMCAFLIFSNPGC